MESPLVSVVVVTYNSSLTVIETLESVRSQTYKKIELIVTDDCSKDDTIAIVESWININFDRFVNCQLIKAPYNTGTTGNVNRGYKAAKGEWIKSIAADDKLLPQAIDLNVQYAYSNPTANLIISKVKGIGDHDAMKNCMWLDIDKFFVRLTEKERRILLCCWNYIPASTVFIKTDFYRVLGEYDESISLIEDWPYWLKFIHNGYHFDYMSEYTTEYRFSAQSISQPRKDFSKRYLEDYKKSVFVANQYLRSYGCFAKWFAWSKEHKNEGYICKLIAFANLLNPFYWYIKYIFYKVR